MKKVISLLLALSMLFSLCITASAAATNTAEGFTLSAGEVKDGKVTLTLTSTTAGDYAMIEGTLAFKPADGISIAAKNPTFDGNAVSAKNNTTGAFNWYTGDPDYRIKVTADGTAIMTAEYEVADTVESGSYPVNLTISNITYYVGTTETHLSKAVALTENIVVEKAGEVAKPTITVEDVEGSNAKTVSITAGDGAEIYYTTDGEDPTAESAKYEKAFPVEESCTVKAIAVVDGESSAVSSQVVEIVVPQPAAKPVLSVSSGENGKTVKITPAEEGDKIYYTTDGSDPTEESEEYNGEFSLTESCTVKAIAVGESGVPSDPVSLTVTIDTKSAEDVDKAIEDAAEGEPVVIDAATADGNSDSTDVVISDISKLQASEKPVEVKTDVADVELPKEVLANGTGSMTVSVSEDKGAVENGIPNAVAGLVPNSDDMKVGQAFDVDVTVVGDPTATDALTEGLIKIRLKGVAAGLKPGDVIAAEDDNGNPYVYTLKTDADDGKEGYMIDGNDVIIYTSHLTKFMILTAKVTPTLTKVELTKSGKTTNQYTVTVADPAIDYFIVFYVVNTDNGTTTLYINPTKMNSTDTTYDFFTNAGSGTLYAYLMAKNPDFTEGMPAVLGVESVTLSALAK